MTTLRQENKYSIDKLLLEALMILASLLVLIPLALIILGSVKTPGEAAAFNLALPKHWVFGNYIEVIKQSNALTAMRNSLIIVGFVDVFTIIFSSLCSFVIARRNTRFTRFLNSYFSLGLIVPLSIIPAIVLLKYLHLLGTLHGMIILYIGLRTPWSIFLLTGFIKSVPREMDEASIVDGCSPFKMFFSVVFPLLKPVIATNIIIVSMGVWNDFMLPLYFLSSSEFITMPLTVYHFFGQYASSWNLVFADLVLTALPIIIAYFYCQKYIVSGLTIGAVKG